MAAEIEGTERIRMKPEGYEPLDKETALRHVDEVEQHKAKTMAGVVLAAQMGRFP